MQQELLSGKTSRVARFVTTSIGALALAACLATPVSAVNLLVNGGFETGDFTGWTTGGNLSFTGVDCFGLHSEGNCAAYLGSTGSDGTLGQSFATVVGRPYFFTFQFLWDGGTPSDFTAFINGSAVFSRVNPPSILNFGTGRAFFTATSALSNIAFSFRNDSGFLYLDNVAVSLPEPATFLLLGLGLAGLGFARRRRSL